MINTRGLSQKDIIFIDDNISNLIDVNEIGISGFLATWGYNSDYDKNEAKKNDIIPIKLSDLQSIL